MSSDTEVADLRRAVGSARRAFARSPLGRLARVMQHAVSEYLTARAEGVSRWDACKGLEEVLRAEIPLSRFPGPCETCDGTGWALETCRHGARCHRRRCGPAPPTWEHPYALPCACPAGDPHRPKIGSGTVEDLATIGRQKKAKRRGFMRLGA